MNTKLAIAYVLFYVFAIAGCSSVTTTDQPQGSVNDGYADQEENIGVANMPGLSVIDRNQIPDESEAVKYLLDSAEQAIRADDYSRAQSLADRALRIERRSARAYLVFAEVQHRTGNIGGALDFARQGLAYASEDSDVGQELVKILKLGPDPDS